MLIKPFSLALASIVEVKSVFMILEIVEVLT